MFITGIIECLIVIALMLAKVDIEWIPVVFLGGTLIAYAIGKKR